MKASMSTRYFGAVSIRRYYRASGWTRNVEECCPKLRFAHLPDRKIKSRT